MADGRKPMTRDDVRLMLKLMKEFAADLHQFGPDMCADVVFGATEVLESMGYFVNLDPGEMPS